MAPRTLRVISEAIDQREKAQRKYDVTSQMVGGMPKDEVTGFSRIVLSYLFTTVKNKSSTLFKNWDTSNLCKSEVTESAIDLQRYGHCMMLLWRRFTENRPERQMPGDMAKAKDEEVQ
ncbi:hypothetical protein CAPTEDRAFT_206491 [Capitella teleta]|uniref:Uncharacterized protein n=1 Tax=Capitella teleta TaxID=283909 RepID=R7T4W1_CAPTE|nr:hypothetical protein CAPTEDRAFT_206491 [Capitella teleta]|eukprot:ELT88028.1 hypothetical protein CAPTEDRAFT_206491 [Capitella teleta]